MTRLDFRLGTRSSLTQERFAKTIGSPKQEEPSLSQFGRDSRRKMKLFGRG